MTFVSVLHRAPANIRGDPWTDRGLVLVPLSVLAARAAAADAGDREVREAHLVAEPLTDEVAHRVELGRVDRGHAAAAFAREVLLVGRPGQREQGRPVAQVDVA